jgi:hypothetical protein
VLSVFIFSLADKTQGYNIFAWKIDHSYMVTIFSGSMIRIQDLHSFPTVTFEPSALIINHKRIYQGLLAVVKYLNLGSQTVQYCKDQSIGGRYSSVP